MVLRYQVSAELAIHDDGILLDFLNYYLTMKVRSVIFVCCRVMNAALGVALALSPKALCEANSIVGVGRVPCHFRGGELA